MERQLGLAPGDGVAGIAEWLVGAPPISLLIEEFLVPGAVIGIFRQGTGPHFRMNLRQGLPALQVSYTLLHLEGPLCRTNGRPERIFVQGKGKGKGNQAKGQGRGKGGRGKGKQDPPQGTVSPWPSGGTRPGRSTPPLTQQQAHPNQANVPAAVEGQVEQQQAGLPQEPMQQPPFPLPNYAPPGHAGSGN